MPQPQDFRSPVDIANRALQHCGARRIVGFDEDSTNAAAVVFVYDKIRKAELRRNVWRFAIRRAMLYPINTPLNPTAAPQAPTTVTQALPTLVLVPEAWATGTTYSFGAVVEHEDLLWLNTNVANVENTPGTNAAWDTYFGSMCIQPFDPELNVGYNTGDLVYTSPGDGMVSVFLSLVSANTEDPRDATSWTSTTAYARGQVVYSEGFYWESGFDLNSNRYPGVYLPWSAATTFAADALTVGTDGFVYTSQQAGNINHQPVGDNGTWWVSTGYSRGAWPMWNSGTTYAANVEVAAVDGFIYQSLVAGNVAHSPATSPTFWAPLGRKNPWTTAFDGSTGNLQWAALDAAVTAINITYPIGSGPSSQSESRNVFRLPNGFLRMAPQDPKAGSTSFLGAPSGLAYNDWVIEGDYITSRTASPILVRFVADVRTVPSMDPMFCEGFAARMALEIVEELTQSGTKMQNIGAAYKTFMGEARTVNGIETGPTEPPEDDFITCRL